LPRRLLAIAFHASSRRPESISSLSISVAEVWQSQTPLSAGRRRSEITETSSPALPVVAPCHPGAALALTALGRRSANQRRSPATRHPVALIAGWPLLFAPNHDESVSASGSSPSSATIWPTSTMRRAGSS
jgi:hypothetical protein